MGLKKKLYLPVFYGQGFLSSLFRMQASVREKEDSLLFPWGPISMQRTKLSGLLLKIDYDKCPSFHFSPSTSAQKNR